MASSRFDRGKKENDYVETNDHTDRVLGARVKSMNAQLASWEADVLREWRCDVWRGSPLELGAPPVESLNTGAWLRSMAKWRKILRCWHPTDR